MIKITVPASKSQTMRALTFASFADGKSQIINPLVSPDIDAMISAIRQMGVTVRIKPDCLEVDPNTFQPDKMTINSGNSGIVLRFITALGALRSSAFQINGDLSIQKNRPIKPLVEALKQLGAKVFYLAYFGHPPISVQGPIRPGFVEMDGADSQPVSAVLIATSFLKNISTIKVTNPGERPWVDLTLHWIKKLGGKVVFENYEKYTVFGNLRYAGFKYKVPADFSSSAFPIIAAIITSTHCVLENLDFDDLQGDKKLIDVLIHMGASIKKDKLNKRLIIYPSEKLKGGIIDVNDIIDAVPILAVLGCFCNNSLELKNCQVARLKECNRLEVITNELKKMGAKIKCFSDSLVVSPSELKAAKVKSHNDHRIAMALCVASLKAKGHGFMIDNTECVKKSYPYFFEDLEKFRN